MTDAEAKKIISPFYPTHSPLARAALHILRRFLDAQATIREMKAIIKALQAEVRRLGGEGMKEGGEYLALKWGTLKRWNVTSERGKALLKEYCELGSSFSAMLQHDTERQKEIIYELIDLVPGKIYLDWDGKYVSKKRAKKYVKEYNI